MDKPLLKVVAAASFALSLAACATVAAPGAEQVRITESPADVQSCKAVGNVDALVTGIRRIDLGNAVVGLGGDTLLMTNQWTSKGIAYRCAKG